VTPGSGRRGLTGQGPARRGLTRALGGVLALAAGAGLVACQDNETAIMRGDRLWADSAFDAAVAEYRLAVAQRDDDHARSRLAHAYARTGRYTEAASVYQDLLPRNPQLVDQAVFDFLHLADRASRRGDVYTASVALDAALQLRPEIAAPGYILPVARFHRQRGESDRAREYYLRAMTTMPPDSAPLVLYELGVLHEEDGQCDVAVDYLGAFRQQARADEPRWRTLVAEARWHMGSCSFRLARTAREDGAPAEALAHLDLVVALGEPEHLLDQAWMDRADLLYDMGRLDDALEAYRRVIERSPTRAGPLVDRAQRRIDEIRFGPRPGFPFQPPPG
jgi:tetratricopeptide (TPR) repeat protein